MNTPEHYQCRETSASLNDISSCIRDGHNILILMRGVPGSGKSYTARKLRDLSSDAKIFSTDDFFYNREGQYVWDAALLDEHHKKTVARVRDAIKDNTKLVIVDNTNILVDHMRPYVHHAVINYYEIYVVEPESEWRNIPKFCARKNIHGVPKDRITYMMEQMLSERTINLQLLVGKSVEAKISEVCDFEEFDHDEKTELNKPPEYPKPISFAPPPGLEVPGVSAGINFASSEGMERILKSVQSPVIAPQAEITLPVFEKGFLSLSAPKPDKSKRVVEQRTVQTQLNELMIPLAEASIPCHITEFAEIGRGFQVYDRDSEVQYKDRPAPVKNDSEKIVPPDDMDILMSMFPYENPEDLKHYYDNLGLTMTIQIFHETGNSFVDHGAVVWRGAYQPHKEERRQFDKPFRGEKEDFNHMSISDDVKVQVKISDLKTILSILFGTGDGSDIPEYLTVNISVLMQLYKQSKSETEEFTNLELDEMMARKLNDENNVPAPKKKERITMAQRIQYLNLLRDYPMVDNRAMYDLFVDNGLNSEFTRVILSAQFDAAGPPPVPQPSPWKTLQRKTIAKGDSLKNAQCEASLLFDEADRLHEIANQHMEKGQKPFKLGGTYNREEGFKYLKEVNRLREKGNEILKQANLQSDFMDFHKMSVSCALETLKEKLKQYDGTSGNGSFERRRKISVITGAGKTFGSKGAIRKEVINFLREAKYRFCFENDGQISIYCK